MLIDSWRSTNQEERKYTYHSPQNATRLDQTWISLEFQKEIQAQIKSPSIFDHCAITLKLNNQLKWGKVTWKLNTELLKKTGK